MKTSILAASPWRFVIAPLGGKAHVREIWAGKTLICKVTTQNLQAAQADWAARLIAAAPELLRAAQLLEAAEDFNANDCRECEGDGAPEACPKCFPLFDDARIARRNAISLATGAS